MIDGLRARRRLPGRRTLAAAVAFGTMALMGGSAVAASGGSSASGWHIGYYTPSSPGTLSNAEAPSTSDGLASLNFTTADNTALLYTDQGGQDQNLLGDLANKSVSASFTVSGVMAPFTYYGEPMCSSTTSYVRFYFQTSNAGGFDETHYWWSNPVHYDLTSDTGGPVTIGPVALGDGSQWSDYFGHVGTDPAYSAGFNAAVSDVTKIGLSFGGGCFFENGIGTTDGSGTFTLNTFSLN